MKKERPKVESKLPKLWPYLVELYATDPSVFKDPVTLRARVATRWKQLNDDEHCPNCGNSLLVAEYTAGIGQGMLLLKMAEAVEHETGKGYSMDVANKIHIDSQPFETSLKKQNSITAYFGLIEQPKEWRQSGYWRITHLGWQVIAGGFMPQRVQVRDRKVLQQSGKTNLAALMHSHSAEVEKQIRLRKAVEKDYRADIRKFDQPRWAEYVRVQTGALL